MGRHSKPSATGRTARNAALITASGALAAIPLTQGNAQAAESDGWAPVIRCESGGNPNAQNGHSSASGLFQFVDPTWLGLGGGEFARRAKDATVEQQYQIANRALERNGLRDWAASKHCWGGKTSASKIKAGRHSKPEAEGAPPTQPRPTPSDGKYTVRPGETLSRIATAHHVSWQQLWESNRAVVADPSLIRAGLKLAIPGSTPAAGPANSAAAPATIGGGERMQVRMTGYSWHDNTPAGSPEISSPVIHKTAGGSGTFADPITVAVPGHAGDGMEQKPGTKFYSPDLRRHLIVEDSGATDTALPHLDVYVDGEGLPKSASDECMDAITGTKTVIRNPGPGLRVTAGPLTGSGGCHI